MSLVTKRDIPLSEYIEGYDLVIPKGTRVTHRTACGYDPSYHFIDDLSWIPKNIGMLRHDCEFYGINIKAEDIEAEGAQS